jgi:hypothetical protein
MRKWINLTEAADPDNKVDYYHKGESHYAPELQERTGFSKWFEGSRVVGPTGKPLIAFHGSFEQFMEFKLESERRRAYGFNRLGFWFDVDPRTPAYFAGYIDNKAGGSSVGGIMPCVLSIKKPFHLDSEYIYSSEVTDLLLLRDRFREVSRLYTHSSRDNLGNIVDRNGERVYLSSGELLTPSLYRDISRKYDEKKAKLIAPDGTGAPRIDGFDRLLKLLPKGAKSRDADVDAFRRELEAEGHDGIYLGDTAADFESRGFSSTDWWIAFKPNQIKSIFAKSFSDSPNIME